MSITTASPRPTRSLGLPRPWPISLDPAVLARLDVATPFLATDTTLVQDKLLSWHEYLPGVRPFYAVKCNPDPQVLLAARAAGASFEIASAGELDLLVDLGVDPRGILYSNPVKPASHVERAARAGVWRFSVDSPDEVDKIARVAPGSAVYVRVTVDDASATFPLSRKFGVTPDVAVQLLRRARALGLQPYGLTFHVGSQSVSPSAWTRALVDLAAPMRTLLQDGIRLSMIDIGGGFPAWYGVGVPSIDLIAAAVDAGLARLPYRPELLVAEPGRHLVAEAGVLVSSVIGREHRGDADWLYLDVSSFHGLMETQQSDLMRYPLWSSRSRPGALLSPFVVTGPTCDSGDTMFQAAELPADLQEGDLVFIGSAGAYTLSYASSFNGFPPPTAVHVD